jgi:hypothetical protein
MTSETAGLKNPAELQNMQTTFDAAWAKLGDMRLLDPARERQQRDRLAGIIVRLMQDGQNERPDIPSDAVEEFQRTSAVRDIPPES